MSIKPEKPYKDILFEVKDQVAWITINRPRVLNAFREQTLDEMIDAVKLTEKIHQSHVLSLRGQAIKHFLRAEIFMQ
jgi:enoyl-CoA hydratase/carnithine racemase